MYTNSAIIILMKRRYDKETLELAVKESITWAEVCRKLGVKPMTGSQTHLKKKAAAWGIKDSHFLGQAFNKGKKFPSKQPVENYLKEYKELNSHDLKNRLFKERLKEERCEICGLKSWQGEPAPLELDHINSKHADNRIENLQILCSNCHTLKTRKDRQAKRFKCDKCGTCRDKRIKSCTNCKIKSLAE